MIRPSTTAPLALLLILACTGGARAGDAYHGRAHRAYAADAIYGVPADGSYGRHRAFLPGAGDAAPWSGRVMVAEYGEPYLPRGVLYNVPGPAPLASYGVVRAKY